jgi:hypothetical protein
MSGIRVECKICGKVYPLVDIFDCDHIPEPENFIGHTLVQMASDQFAMRLEYERRQESAVAEIQWLEDLFKAA